MLRHEGLTVQMEASVSAFEIATIFCISNCLKHKVDAEKRISEWYSTAWWFAVPCAHEGTSGEKFTDSREKRVGNNDKRWSDERREGIIKLYHQTSTT